MSGLEDQCHKGSVARNWRHDDWRQWVLKTKTVGSSDYRDAMAHYAGHVQLVTTAHAGQRRGVTVTAACSVSDDPPTVLSDALAVFDCIIKEHTIMATHMVLFGEVVGLRIGNRQSSLLFMDREWRSL